MEKKFKIIVFAICCLLLMNVWLPPEKEKINPTDSEQDIINKILFPLNKLQKPIDNIKISAHSLASDTAKLGSSADNISFDPVKNIQEPDVQSGIIMVLQGLIETPQLESKSQYINAITNYKTTMESNQYKEINNVTEQLFSFKNTHYNLNNEISINKTRIQVMDSYIRNSVKTSGDKLNQIKSIPGIATKIPKNIDSLLGNLKNRVSGETNLMNELNGMLDKNTTNLANMQVSLIARLNNQPVPEPVLVQEKKISQDQFNNLATKMSELSAPAPAQLNLNKELQKAAQYFHNNELDKATEILQKEITKDPNNWKARKYMAQVYIADKDYDKAIEEINKALESFKKKTKVE